MLSDHMPVYLKVHSASQAGIALNIAVLVRHFVHQRLVHTYLEHGITYYHFCLKRTTLLRFSKNAIEWPNV